MHTINRWANDIFSSLLLSLTLISLSLLPLPFLFLPSSFLSPSPISLPPPPPPVGRHSVHESEGSRDYAGVAHLAPSRRMHLRWSGQWCTTTLSEREYSVPQTSVFLLLSPCSSMCATTFLYSSKLYMLTPLLLTLIPSLLISCNIS